MGITKKELILEGLDCANCASKIENRVNKLEDIKNANLNFMTKTLKVEITANVEKTVGNIREIVKKLEPHVMVKDKNSNITKTYTMKGLT
ncbi:cation transporter [Dethiothermospora halolimnae]|uniref:cation transporter n=1 Tax=Dethiothermospora halolimnae TaxID=3114390 RepID=UPI003CCB9F2B